MTQEMIISTLQALKPVLKSTTKAKTILEKFWEDKLALIWTAQDVHTAANEREIALTEKEARFVLQQLEQFYNRQYGVRWEDLGATVEGHGLGRQMTRAEVSRFVKKNVLTIGAA